VHPTDDERPYLHDLRLHLFELRLFTDVVLHENVALEVQLPVRVTATSIVFRRLEDGSAFVPAEGNLHHRTETLLGLGDAWLQARGQLTLGGFHLAARLGVTLPLGTTEENPFALGDAGLPHQHLQFGTGTFNPLSGLEVARAFGPVTVSAFGQAVWMAYQNPKGYQAGHRITATLRGDVKLGPVRPLLGVDVLHEEPERWDGAIQQDGNLGRTDFLVSAGLTANLSDDTALTVLARVPFAHRFIHGSEHEQLTYPVVLSVMISSTRRQGL
jgi:hypothetical protein